MALSTRLQSLNTFINSTWSRIPEVEQVVVFETDGIVDIHTAMHTTSREACYKIYALERELTVQFPDMLFDFNLALNRYEAQNLGKPSIMVVYDKTEEKKHA